MNSYITSIKKQFAYYKSIADQTFAQLDTAHFFWQYNGESNSMAMIIQHLHGNMLSRFTDFLTSDGEKDWRVRNTEFEYLETTKEALLEQWETGWAALFNAIDNLTDHDMEKDVFIRNEKHTVIEAINRQLAHYPYHIGQLVYIGKMLRNQDWTSLSIPRGKSETHNANMFAKNKQ